MIAVRKSAERGATRIGWLDSKHSFSFGHYHDPAHMGFGPLRVINDDRVAPGAGFGTHGHDNMEILSIVLEGGLAHKDSIGTGSTIKPGEIQRMTAGSGIEHSEFNASKADPVHFLQIWILPEKRNLAPSYEQKAFDDRDGKLRLIGARDGRDGAVTIHQDVDLYATRLAAGEGVSHELGSGRRAWVQVTKGGLSLNGKTMQAGDGAAITDEPRLDLVADGPAEALLFDMAA